MTTPEVADKWYQALVRKDCVQIMRMLKEHPTLLMVGWTPDPLRLSNGDRDEAVQWKLSNRGWDDGSGAYAVQWRGCTALHVAAQQGCVDLIVQVLLLFDFLNLDVLRSYHSEHRNIQLQKFDVASKQGQSNPAASEGTENGLNSAGDDTAHLKQKITKEKEIAPDGEHPSVDTISNDSFSREDLGSLLLAKDGDHNVVALAMASVHWNDDANILLIYAYGELDSPPFGIRKSTLKPLVLDSEDMEGSLQLRHFTENYTARLDDTDREEFFSLYERDAGLNFLPLKEYFFHFLVSLNSTKSDEVPISLRRVLINFWVEVTSRNDSLWRFLLELRDGQGRTPFQLTIDGVGGDLTVLHDCLKIGSGDEKEVVICALTACDGAGRSPAHRAAVTGAHEAIRVLLLYSGRYEEVSATFRATWKHPCASGESWSDETLQEKTQKSGRWKNLSSWRGIPAFFQSLSLESGFGLEGNDLQPLHAAIVQRNFRAAKLIMEEASLLRLDTSYDMAMEIGEQNDFEGKSDPVAKCDILAFTYYAGIATALGRRRSDDVSSKEFLEFLVKKLKGRVTSQDSVGRKNGAENTNLPERLKMDLKVTPCKALQIAASRADYKMLYWLLYPPKCDHAVEDFRGNNALHYALEVREFPEFKLHLLDHVQLLGKCIKYDKEVDGRRNVERQGCVNLLLQAGCDIFKENLVKEAPYPQGSCGQSPEFLSWWVEKQLKEFKATQSNYNSITTAISVTATLIATASYVGPLTPPLGLVIDHNSDEIQYQNRWVATFVFCDNLSFYLAIIALILSLVSSLPVPTQSMKSELVRTWTTIVLAMVALLPSIASVLIAFASSSMAVVSSNLTSSIGGNLTIAPLSSCVPLIIVAFLLLLVRMLMSLFPRNRLVKYLYKSTDIVFR